MMALAMLPPPMNAMRALMLSFLSQPRRNPGVDCRSLR
jgi:hypothetical protein